MLERVFRQSTAALKVNHLNVKEFSHLFIQLYFLEMVWTYLFGVVAGQSPWHKMVVDLDPATKNGLNDEMLPIDALLKLALQNVTRDVENTIASGRKSRAFGDPYLVRILTDNEDLGIKR
ncbi:hypothetical protein KJ359_012453 [Pestalotiopsis sp. 9143b]|nr:hypothetical protein KJ359_012453 [Pestalotiopsis sp. 9143b]